MSRSIVVLNSPIMAHHVRSESASRAATETPAQAIPNRARCSSHAIGRRVSPASFFALSASGWRSRRMVFTTAGAMDALERAGIRVVLAKHENCAGFMGEGVHHRDLTPAILVATIGPGIANAVNVIANCFQDRVPMVALTGCVSPGEQHSYTHQVFDHVRLVEPIAKAAFRVEDGMAAILADKAVAIATGGRPGPVFGASSTHSWRWRSCWV